MCHSTSGLGLAENKIFRARNLDDDQTGGHGQDGQEVLDLELSPAMNGVRPQRARVEQSDVTVGGGLHDVSHEVACNSTNH